MKEKIIGNVGSFVFGQRLIISLDLNWIQVFGGTLPTFSVMIDKDQRLHLVGPVIPPKKGVK